MQRERSSYPDKRMFLDSREQPTTSSEELSSTLKQSLQDPSEESPPNTKGMRKYSVNKNRKGYPDTPFGITPLNYSHGPPHHYHGNFFPSPKKRPQQCKNS